MRQGTKLRCDKGQSWGACWWDKGQSWDVGWWDKGQSWGACWWDRGQSWVHCLHQWYRNNMQTQYDCTSNSQFIKKTKNSSSHNFSEWFHTNCIYYLHPTKGYVRLSFYLGVKSRGLWALIGLREGDQSDMVARVRMPWNVTTSRILSSWRGHKRQAKEHFSKFCRFYRQLITDYFLSIRADPQRKQRAS